MPSTTLKSVKGGKTDDEFAREKITLRGVEYTITEIDASTYDDLIKAAEDANGMAAYGTLVKLIVMKAVSPSIAARSKPLPYSVYRTLEKRVEIMHFTDVPDETPKPDEAKADDESTADEEMAKPPNE